jgi:hypothetical protein
MLFFATCNKKEVKKKPSMKRDEAYWVEIAGEVTRIASVLVVGNSSPQKAIGQSSLNISSFSVLLQIMSCVQTFIHNLPITSYNNCTLISFFQIC